MGVDAAQRQAPVLLLQADESWELFPNLRCFLRGSASKCRIIVLIVFPILGMFFATLLQNGRLEQLKTILIHDRLGTGHQCGRCGRRSLEARSPGEKQRGTIPGLKANRPGWSARAIYRKRGATHKSFVIAAIIE